MYRHHQKLVLGFLQNATKMLSSNGEVHVTLKIVNPFNKWDIVKLAEKAGLILVEKVPFKMREYPCYANKIGSGSNWNQKFDVGSCNTFKFSKGRDVVESFVGLSDILVDPSSLHLKDASDCELKSLNEDHMAYVSTSTYLVQNTIQDTIHSSFNFNTQKKSIAMCTIL